MMKKFLVALLFVGCSHVALAAPQTFDEAFQSMNEKTSSHDLSAILKEADHVLALAQTNEQKAKVRFRTGDAYFYYNEIKAALQQYEEILKLPNLDSGLKNAALIKIGLTYRYQQPSNYGKARSTFQRIVDGKEFSDEEKISARLQIASTYGQAGDSTTAQKQLKSIAQDATVALWARASALQSLAEMDLVQKNYAEARGIYQQIAALNPNAITVNTIALDGIAQTYFDEKNYPQARQKFAEILKLDIEKVAEPNLPDLEMLQASAQMDIAQSYANEGDKTRARAEFAKVSQMPGGRFFAVQVKNELKQLDKKPEFAQ